jgi:YidC/Oxa1 family membrane protein insertase
MHEQLSGGLTTAPPPFHVDGQGASLQLHHHDQHALLCTSTETAGPLLGAVQDALQALHDTTGLPWWATLVTATLCVRSSLLPLALYQMRASARFGGAMPYMLQVKDALQRRFKELDAAAPSGTAGVAVKAEQLRQARRGLQLTWRKFDCHPAKLFLTPVVHFPVFITYVFAVRDMIRGGEEGAAPGLAAEGALWFPDLTVMDGTYVLPALAIGLTYVNLEQSLGGGPKSGWLYKCKNALQTAMLLLGVFTSQLPAGVFMYWVTSASYGIVQTATLRSPAVQKALGLGKPPHEQMRPPPKQQQPPPPPPPLHQREQARRQR